MSDQITISCPHCNGESHVDGNRSGQIITCPHCSGKLTVPESYVSPAPVSPAPVSSAPVSSAPVSSAPAPSLPVSPRGYQGVSENIIEPLARTQGWARFLSILGFIGCGLMVLLGLATLVGGLTGFGDSVPIAIGTIVGFFYLAMAVLYFFPALKLTQYASRIAALRESQSEQDLVSALDAQRSFWAFVGIMAIVTLGLYLLIILIAVGSAF